MAQDGLDERGQGDPELGMATRRVDRPDVRLPVVIAVGLMLLLAFPLAQEVAGQPMTTERLIACGGLALFVAVYLWAVPADIAGRGRGRVQPAVVALSALAIAVSLVDRGAEWTLLFAAAATAAGRITPSRRSVVAIAAIAATTAAVLLVVGRPVADAIESMLEVVLVGLMVLAFSGLERTARELESAQAEVARLAAESERTRIARDLHDLLGHSLSVIALKTELARRLVGRDPARAATELTEVESVVRTSLGDVRRAVAGYRRVALETELAGAEIALRAAGVEVEVRRPTEPLDEPTDAVLGWIVREGVTNLIRHSAARHCWIRVDVTADRVGIEIRDDGHGIDLASASPARQGSGLRGIRERLDSLGGRLEAGAADDRGYRLMATIPRTAPLVTHAAVEGSG